ncbi:MAG TPA: hypothetical protein VLL51_09240 [Gemmatimonadales bacterium]|nr:hypothetical protein [Gemmatimonadales bacterium]
MAAARLDGLNQLRIRDARGGVIQRHRAMIGLRWSPARVVRAAALAVFWVAAVVLAIPWLARAYAAFYEEIVWWVGLPAGVSLHQLRVGELMTVGIPYFRLAAPWPEPIHWIIVGGLTVLAVALSFTLPDRFLPARYFLRFLALVQSVALAWFALASPPFLYPLPGYTAGLLTAGLAVLVLIPLVLGFAFYIFDHSLRQQLALTVMLLGHLVVFLPIQVLIHAWLAHHLSALVQPTLFFLFGLLLEVLVFVAFYGWAMSWQGTELPASAGPGAKRP